MLRKKIISFIFIGIILVIIIFSLIPTSSNINYKNSDNSNTKEYPNISASLEGAENILITGINREAEINGYGLINIEDEITIKNMNDNPITSIYVGVPLIHSEDLVFYEAEGEEENSLSIERDNLVMGEFEMIAIYFDSPLKPQESNEVRFIHSYKNMLIYSKQTESQQKINFTGYVFPLMPYRAQGSIKAVYEKPESSRVDSSPSWGAVDNFEDTITFTNNSLDPFLTNIEQDGIIEIILSDDEITRLEFNEINREIYISPWGIIKVTENYDIRNEGAIELNELNFEIPGPAKDIKVYDDLGEILGVEITPEENYYNLTYKDLYIDLSENRVDIIPDSKFIFSIEYFLPFEKYFSLNWILLSIKMDLLTTIYEYLGADQTVKIIIEGCFSLDYVSEPPVAIEYSQNSLILVYESDYVVPFQDQEIQFTFIINYLDMSLRPITFILLIAIISTGYVILIKTRKEAAEIAVFRKDLLPINEIREFCSLYDEKNALLLEIRQAEEDVKRKKIIKKKYRNILDNNKKKIEEIDKEIIAFKKIVRDVNATFENLINKLEVLEAERVSIEDSLNLLEARYRRGRLPSRKAYLNLSENFLRRRKKIDRSIDRNIQQLRSYLL
ncbi:MAG: hypothetical protein EU532_02235 [Promethearchaeota archaeon]|nr:MAG: hypothetical protein EU532_02235 [Candidatus Lokiarchaeota archaeon]